MSLRVLHVDTGREWRGGQRQVYLLARTQRERGDEPLVVAQKDAPLITRLRAHGLAAAGVRIRGEWDLAAAQRVRLLIRRWRADVVHAHDARGHAIAMAALIGRPDIPLIVTRRVTFVPRGRLKYGRRVARFIAISAAVRDALELGGVDPARIDIVYSGVPAPQVDVARDWRAECGWPSDAVLCGVVGAMTAEKGMDLLGDVAHHVPETLRARARLVLLGGASAGTTNIGGIAAYRAGFVDGIHAAMAGLDVLWHPAVAEGLGTALLDAMALGVPPVAFRVGGIPELIVDGVTGLLAEPGSVSDFARAAASLIAEPQIRQELAKAGPPQAARFSVDRMVDGTANVYRGVLGHRVSTA